MPTWGGEGGFRLKVSVVYLPEGLAALQVVYTAAGGSQETKAANTFFMVFPLPP